VSWLGTAELRERRERAVIRPRISFGKIAHRVGAVTKEQLEEARAARDESDGDLEAILLESGAISQELADLVREAFVRACAICEGCGRRTDTEERDNDWVCKCGGTFVPLEQTLEPGAEVNPEFLQSEVSSVSDYGQAADAAES
jgi:hypothetical protein